MLWIVCWQKSIVGIDPTDNPQQTTHNPHRTRGNPQVTPIAKRDKRDSIAPGAKKISLKAGAIVNCKSVETNPQRDGLYPPCVPQRDAQCHLFSKIL